MKESLTPNNSTVSGSTFPHDIEARLAEWKEKAPGAMPLDVERRLRQRLDQLPPPRPMLPFSSVLNTLTFLLVTLGISFILWHFLGIASYGVALPIPSRSTVSHGSATVSVPASVDHCQ